MVFPWGVAAGVGLSAGLGALGSNPKRHRRYRNTAIALYNRLLTKIDQGYAPSLSSLNRSIVEGTRGFDQARKEVTDIGRGTRQRLLDREQQGGAQIEQNLVSRGLSGTTAGTGARRGLMSDTNRQLAELDDHIAQLYSQIAAQRGTFRAQGFNALAQGQQNLASAKIGAEQSKITFVQGLAGQNVPSQGGMSESLGQALGYFLPYLTGGGKD